MQRRNWFYAAPARRTATTVTASLSALTILFAASRGLSQSAPELPQPSPKGRVEQRVGVTDFAVDFSSPGVKGRKVWGELVPYDKLWRTGANSATKLTVSRDFSFGGKAVAAGAYALYTIPGQSSWTIILNSNATAAGTTGYDEKNDIARVSVKPTSAALRERLAFVFSDTTDDSTRLDIEWEKLRVSVPIQVDTRAHVATNIDKAVDDAWRPHFASARWLLDNGGDLQRALGYIDTSIAIKPTWWNHWVRAQILAKQGNSADAVIAAEKALELGQGDQVFEGNFKGDITKAINGWRK